MIVLAWILAIVGALIAYVITLAGAMRSVPQLYWREALVAVPLPILTAALALWCLVKPGSAASDVGPRPWVAAGVPLAVALLTLILIATSYFDQPGGAEVRMSATLRSPR
jgi:hypothetical protein